ncbi:PREDICTED: uncharacterized protein LOC108563105 [Nicrophorus vespilloides]|uniref:Uncharacterized protein LOC108563105 n=1 Tax=Nicrophorus vespilloides TaxID=110193 RepID=A0ABM1MRH3_NICVS|nr:PREDICTED: uncharacterized protein LOC108563105 [Nicrophorus vespilloides]
MAASPTVYYLNIDSKMHNANGKLVGRGEALNGSNIIFLRGAKTSDSGHILLRADGGSSKTAGTATNRLAVLEDAGEAGGGGKLGQIFIQQGGDLAEGVFLQSVKRFGGAGGAPILLLSGNDNGNIFIQTTTAAATEEAAKPAVETGGYREDNILVQALEGLQDSKDPVPAVTARTVSTPLGSAQQLL